ncbi:lipoprotein-releasing ABC transporter permease subunit [Desulfobulbus oralis]|uniref:Lipoprotein-releasing system transmembrane subunit LolC n=1 Tax=Desulfobulbus oralis TaxID=1986146 RepID=A0A2L1GNE5_9BACT|nr:lipoprotein-releasing ABC transporter permease subunit [Desulfobulbus oralis]AVD71168.1 lipoprotein-releasing system transmembrane subunit LolC [Desulfobulbus oralis]
MPAFAWFVSLRYLRAKRKQKFISLITLISILGVAVGVMALIVVLAVYTGFTEGLRDQIIGINSHVIVQSYAGAIRQPRELMAAVAATPGVVAQTPVIYTQALITSNATSSGVVLHGIDPESNQKVVAIGEKMKSGALESLNQEQPPTIVLGSDLARTLQVLPGDRVQLLAPNGPLTPMGVLPKLRVASVSGIFATGMYEYDANAGYLGLDLARSLAGLEPEAVHAIEVRVQDVERADAVAAAIGQRLGSSYVVRDWMQLNQNLFAALKLEKLGIFIALDLIILVAALNIISALIMLVMEKNRDIAILKSMGATTSAIMRIFLYQGLVIGVTGTILGVFSGLGLCRILKTCKIIELPANVYPMSTIPIKVVPADVTLIAVSALVITLLATLYPSRKAAGVQPAEALSYE